MVPEGVVPIVRIVSSESQQRTAVDQIIKEWKNEYRLKPSQLAILASSKRASTCLASTPRSGGLPITEDPELWRTGQGVLFSTITSFKGLESEAVILLQSADHSHTADLDRYVATSRAKHLLAVIDTTDFCIEASRVEGRALRVESRYAASRVTLLVDIALG